jgi:hypothetical protein
VFFFNSLLFKIHFLFYISFKHTYLNESKMKKEEIFLLSLKVELSSKEVFINIKLINFKASLTKNLGRTCTQLPSICKCCVLLAITFGCLYRLPRCHKTQMRPRFTSNNRNSRLISFKLNHFLSLFFSICNTTKNSKKHIINKQTNKQTFCI